MAINLFNSLTQNKDQFQPITPNKVGIYSCGPTVYNYAHIGNLRSYVFADLLKRMFLANGYQVKHVMNITDVDDKTIRDSQASGEDLATFTRRFEDAFFADCTKLNIQKPEATPRATENINQMIALIEKLLEQGCAYKSEDGIYFSIDKSKDYGKIANLEKRTGQISRIKNDEYDKANPQDFALWKFHTEADGSVLWAAPFGDGRPGWHIECSAMSTNALGNHFDIHTGGIDLLFPHHTNEIAQSECATGEPYVNYWLHSGHILVDGKKMSKSVGNVFNLSDITEKGISPLAYRFWLLSGGYKTTMNFTWEALKAAETGYKKLLDILSDLAETGSDQTSRIETNYNQQFINLISDDLNTPGAVALVWEFLKDEAVTAQDKVATLLEWDNVLGLDLSRALIQEEIPIDVLSLAEERETAREAQNWALADELRQRIENTGYTVKDTPEGQKIRKK